MKKNLPLLIMGLMLIGACASTAYLHHTGKRLQANLIDLQEQAQQKMETLEVKIERLERENNALISSNRQNVPSPGNIEVNSGNDFTPTTPNSMPTITEMPPEAHTSRPGPNLTVTPETFDLGTLSKKDGIAVANFELKNTGTSDLTITHAFTSCGCTVSPIEEEIVLASGETHELKVTYDPNFYGTQYELGQIEKAITIISNDSSKPFYKVKIKGNVVP